MGGLSERLNFSAYLKHWKLKINTIKRKSVVESAEQNWNTQIFPPNVNYEYDDAHFTLRLNVDFFKFFIFTLESVLFYRVPHLLKPHWIGNNNQSIAHTLYIVHRATMNVYEVKCSNKNNRSESTDDKIPDWDGIASVSFHVLIW